MESISTIEAQKRLKELGLKFVTVEEVIKLTGAEKRNTAHKMLLRWAKYGILERCSRGIYLVSDTDVDDFEIANRLVEPSYVSLEKALNFYGILPQFPYTTTSVTVQKSRSIQIRGKEFEYTKLTNDLYWGYEKVGEAIMALPEKAIIDYLYLAAKGLRRADISEWDLSKIDKTRLNEYIKKVNYAPFAKLVRRLHLI